MLSLPKRTRAPVDAQINIVPYIDVMLVLLVIFMMTTPIMEQGIEVDLPTSSETGTRPVEFTEQQPSIITINKNGEYFINSLDSGTDSSLESKRLALSVIAGRIAARLEIYPNMKVFVRGDAEVAYGSVVALMSFLQDNGVQKVGMITQSIDAK
jgi:biopolymer transport protein TolR